MNSWPIVIAGFAGAFVTALVSLVPLRLSNRLETRRLELQERAIEVKREDSRRRIVDRLIQGCCESAGIYIGLSDRSARGDRVAATLEHDARGQMYAAWARFLPYAGPLQRGIIRTFLSTMTNESDDKETPTVVKQSLKNLLDASTEDMDA